MDSTAKASLLSTIDFSAVKLKKTMSVEGALSLAEDVPNVGSVEFNNPPVNLIHAKDMCMGQPGLTCKCAIYIHYIISLVTGICTYMHT